MWTKKLCTFVLLFSLSVLPAVGYCSGTVYPITAQELNRLDQIFSQLSDNNNKLLTELATSKQDLAIVQQQLADYQSKLQALQAQLVTLQTESAQAKTQLEQAQTSLQKAGESLNRLEAEYQSKIRSLQVQRDIGWIAAAAILLFKH